MAPSTHTTLGTYANKNLGAKSFKNPKNVGHQRLKRLESVARGDQHDDRHRQRLQVLLEVDVLIGGQQRVEVGGGLSE